MTIKLFGGAIKSLPQQVEENTKDIAYLKERYPFNLKGNFDVSLKYVENDLVTYNESSYIAKQSVQGVLPNNEVYWQLIASCNADISRLETKADHDSDITTLEKDILKNETAVTNIETKINSLTKTVEINTRDITNKVDINKLYIPGEYKYMNENVIMPIGWVKITSPANVILTSANYLENPKLNLFGAEKNGNSNIIIDNINNYVNYKIYNNNNTVQYEYNFLNCNLWIYDPEKKFTK